MQISIQLAVYIMVNDRINWNWTSTSYHGVHSLIQAIDRLNTIRDSGDSYTLANGDKISYSGMDNSFRINSYNHTFLD